MPQPQQEEVIITKDGQFRAILSPLIDRVTRSLGPRTIRRASHVEPTTDLSQAAMRWLYDNQEWTEFVVPVPGYGLDKFEPNPEHRNLWWADMTPVEGPVLGPYDTREEALAREVDWLKEQGIPVAGEQTAVPA